MTAKQICHARLNWCLGTVLWKLWVAIFRQICAANPTQVSFTADVSSQTQKGRKVLFWIVPILSQWWKYSHLGADGKCQGRIGEWSRYNYERSGNKRNLSTFPLLLVCFMAFRGHETCFQYVFLSIACVVIYGFWWESKSLIALICIFINFSKEKKWVISCVNPKSIASALELEVFGGRLYLKIWITPFSVFNLAERGGKRQNEMKSNNCLNSNTTEENQNWWGKMAEWHLGDLQPGKSEGEPEGSIFNCVPRLRGYRKLFTNIKWGMSRNFISFWWYW